MRTICFVKRNPQIRIYKQAKALKRTGRYRLILIAQRYDKELFKDVFDEIIDFGSEYYSVPDFGFHLIGKDITLRNILRKISRRRSNEEKELAKIVKETDADLFHAHAGPNIFPKIVIENATKPVVFDAYDFSGISSGIENLDEKERIAEKYCLEHADGIVRKGPPFEIDYYRQHGYKITCPEIQWMDYCDEDLFVDMNAKKLSAEDGELHLVYTGAVCVDPKYAFCYFIPLGKQLAKQKIHLHLYSNPYQYATSKEYIELDKKEKYFHFHNPVPFKELNKEIAKYDWGLWYHLLGEGSWGNTVEKRKTGIGNKLFSYLEACLPIIITERAEYGEEIVDEYGIGFAIEDEDLIDFKEMIVKRDYNEMKQNVISARKELCLNEKIKDLENFYTYILNTNDGEQDVREGN